MRDLLSEFVASSSKQYELKDSNPYYDMYERSETELDKLAKKDKIPLRWKLDPMMNQEFPIFERASTVYGVNNAHFALVEQDGEEKIKKAWKATIVSV